MDRKSPFNADATPLSATQRRFQSSVASNAARREAIYSPAHGPSPHRRRWFSVPSARRNISWQPAWYIFHCPLNRTEVRTAFSDALGVSADSPVIFIGVYDHGVIHCGYCGVHRRRFEDQFLSVGHTRRSLEGSPSLMQSRTLVAAVVATLEVLKR